MTGVLHNVQLTDEEDQQLQFIRANFDKMKYVIAVLTDATTRQCIIHKDAQGAIRKVESIRIDYIMP